MLSMYSPRYKLQTKHNIRVNKGPATSVNFELSPLKGQQGLNYEHSFHEISKRSVDDLADSDYEMEEPGWVNTQKNGT